MTASSPVLQDGDNLIRNKTLNTGSRIRKNKPLMEKRRRARINHSLSILRELVVDKEDKGKLEKADILRLTVLHLQKLQQHPCYDDGYQECLKFVVQFLKTQRISKTMIKELLTFLHFRDEHYIDSSSSSTSGSSPCMDTKTFYKNIVFENDGHGQTSNVEDQNSKEWQHHPLDLSNFGPNHYQIHPDIDAVWRPWCRK